jgi:hypothetical protein
VPAHTVTIQVHAPKTLQVRTLSARVHAIDLDVDLGLLATRLEEARTWEGTTSFPDAPRLMRVRLFCGDSYTEEVCFDGIHFPDSLDHTTVAIQLVARPNGVWGRLDDPGLQVPLSLQFGAGLAVLWLAAWLYLRRVWRG